MKHLALPITLLVCALFSSSARAAIYAEVGDTGDLLATAQNVGAGVDTITGSTSTSDRVDLFRVDLPGGIITFETRRGTMLDPNMLLFNAAGNPLAGNDDGASFNPGIPGGAGLDAHSTLNLAAGTYYVAVGGNNLYGLDAGNSTIVGNDSGVENAAGVLAGWDVRFSFNPGTYTILISTPTVGSAAVPEPSSLLIFGGLASLLATRLRRKK